MPDPILLAALEKKTAKAQAALDATTAALEEARLAPDPEPEPATGVTEGENVTVNADAAVGAADPTI